MEAYEITAKMNLKDIITEARDVAQVFNEFANNLEQIEKKYNKEVDVLDQIRSEIVHLHDWAFSREEILRIIDKYKTESEDKE